jgi:hypothetical protein
VVIVIIGILASIVIVSVQAARVRAAMPKEYKTLIPSTPPFSCMRMRITGNIQHLLPQMLLIAAVDVG